MDLMQWPDTPENPNGSMATVNRGPPSLTVLNPSEVLTVIAAGGAGYQKALLIRG